MQYKVFISCPGDVKHEKKVVRDVCDEITRAKRPLNIELIPLDWENEVNHLITGESAQKVIYDQIGDYDIYVGILWHVFGKPQKNLQGRTPTEDEFEDALSRQQKDGRPVIKFFFKNSKFEPTNSEEEEQYAEVRRFKKNLEKRDPGLYDTFQSATDFHSLLHGTLCDVVDNYAKYTSCGILIAKRKYHNIDDYISRSVLPIENVIHREPLAFALSMNSAQDLTVLVSREKRVVLLGDAGVGKSTELMRLASHFASEPNEHLHPYHQTLNTYMGDKLDDLLPTEFSEIPDKCKLLILDGFDEVQDKHRFDTARRIEKFSEDHPQSHMLVSSRTNFYASTQNNSDGTLKGFKAYSLLDLNQTQIENYVNKKLGRRNKEFLSSVMEGGIGRLVRNPFYLATLVQCFRENVPLPSNRSSLFEWLMDSRSNFDSNKFKNSIELNEQKVHATALIERIAISMEMLGRNYVSSKEYESIVPSFEDRSLVRHMGIWRQCESAKGITWQFEHNNFQEFLAARVLSQLPLDQVKEYVAFGSEFKRIIPSWINTVSFLLDLYPNDSMSTWLMKCGPEVVVRVEPERIEFPIRLKIFKGIIEEYKKKKIRIDSDRFDTRTLAQFVDDRDYKEVRSYLIEELEQSENHTHTCNVLRVLQWMTIPISEREKVSSLLVKIALSYSEDEVVKHLALVAMTNLEMNIGQNVSLIAKELRSEKSDWIRYGLYYYLHNSDQLDENVGVFLEGISLLQVSHSGSRESRLGNEHMELTRGLAKVTSYTGLTTILSHFESNPSDISLICLDLKRLRLVENAVKIYPNNEEMFEKVLSLLVVFVRQYYEKESIELVKFFKDTQTKEKAFNYFLADQEISKECPRVLAYLAERKSLELLVKLYKKGEVTDDLVFSVRNVLRWQFPNLADWFQDYLNKETSDKFALTTPRDYDAEKNRNLEKSIRVIFDKNMFLSEINTIFDLIGDESVSAEEMMTFQYEGDMKSDVASIVIDEIRRTSWERVITREQAINSVEGCDWESFKIQKLYEILTRNKDVELNGDQICEVSEWCRKNLDRCDFTKSIIVNRKNSTISTLSIYLWYFYRRLDLTYPSEVLLDMTLYDYPMNTEYSGIEYLIDKLPEPLMSERVLENLERGIVCGFVLKNNLRYCKRVQLNESIPYTLKIVCDSAWDDNVRGEAIDLICSFPNSIRNMESVLGEVSDSFVWNIVENLWNQNSQVCKEFLNERLNGEDGEEREFAAGYLIENGSLEALEFYVERSRETKKALKRPWRAAQRNPLTQVTAEDGLQKLLLILKESYSKENDNEEINDLRNVALDGLTAFALRSEGNYDRTVSKLERFVSSNQKLKDVNYLNAYVEKLTRQYYVNKSGHYKLDEVLKKVNELTI